MDQEQERTFGMLCHLLAFAFFIPFGNIIAPLVLWLMYREKSDFIDHHGKEVINFQITATIAAFIAGLLLFVIIGLVLLPIVIIGSLVLTIMAAIKAKEGDLYQYPLSIRLIK